MVTRLGLQGSDWLGLDCINLAADYRIAKVRSFLLCHPESGGCRTQDLTNPARAARKALEPDLK